MTITIETAVGDKGEVFEACLGIRMKVFVQEQGFVDEIDNNESAAIHILALDQGKPVGTVRLVLKNEEKCKLTRLAVLSEYRKFKLGGMLIETLINKARQLQLKEIICHSQLPVVGLYQRYGFQVFGGKFDEDGAPHLPLNLHL